MADGFWSGLNQHLLFWSGWVFTVGGTVAALSLSKEYGWVGALFAVTGLIPLTTFAYQKHREKQEAEQRHGTDTARMQADLQSARERTEQAERKLNEVPANLLRQLQVTIQAHAFEDLAKRLARHADYVGRMVGLAQVLTKPLTLRAFVKRNGLLYVEGRLSSEGLQQLRQDDLFVLAFKHPNGLVTESAMLRVHQMDAAKELIWFHVISMQGGEMIPMDALADKQEVPAKGYSARPVCEPAQYANLNPEAAAAALRQLTADLTRLSRSDT